MTSRTQTLLLLFSIAMPLALPWTAAAQEIAPDVRGAARPGWTLALGTLRTHLLFDDEDQLFSSGPVDIDHAGRGGFIEAGYAFSPGFALQLRFSGAEHSTGDPDRTAAFGHIQLEAVAHLTETGFARPYVAGGLGAAFLGIEEVDASTNVLVGGSTAFGGGLEIFLSRRFAMSFDYRFGLVNFENEIIEDKTTSTEIAVDRSMQSHSVQTRVVFSF
jgi:hypothetical protein